MARDADVVIVGSGPNGLAAAIALQQAGAQVLVLEGHRELGGGMRSAELTLPGFLHDVCSAAHPMGILSPYLRTLPLEQHGLVWMKPKVSVAHPLDEGDAVLLHKSVDETARALGVDERAYRSLVTPFLRDPHAMFADALAPLRIPKHPLRMARFGLHAIRSAVGLAGRFSTPQARALLAGCAAHSILPLEQPLTAAVGLIFLLAGHVEEWPVARGGSRSITNALVSLLRSLGGEVRTDTFVRTLSDLPPARRVLFDTSPAQLALICAPVLPNGYVRRLLQYRYGPGVFKIDYALDGPIPWRDARCREASTVHVGGTLEQLAEAEGAVGRGEHAARPFVMVVQQSECDDTRAPAGKHTGYAYVHVPSGSTIDQTEVIEAQLERFAPGFKQRVLARHTMGTQALAEYNANNVGGAITGGMADLGQLFTRPVARLDPYTTPNPRVLICSASTPPGGGVHGMCGYFAAQRALKGLERIPVASFGGGRVLTA
ncbi:MAG: NAD(P)/FAD-dependent oxidoreductase [Deltaproteobacteria bacterium]|nr:NAD(P)/FAD-dependent oxidoreductase [Deltaproteobacteria bacterium]